jgi:DNA-directed RNA polymerase sigma subunit (sigma70/sigma32)
MTLSQVAERLGLTSARIQQIEKGALAKMKKLM